MTDKASIRNGKSSQHPRDRDDAHHRAVEPSAAGHGSADPVDAAALERQLRAAVRGEVRFDATSRALYATDASNYRQVPIGVVIPRDADDVLATLRACHAARAPVLPRGCGTSLCGQACNVAVVIDCSRYMNRVIAIDPDSRSARVQPGLVLDDLRAAAAPHGLTFAPDPSTHNHNTLGGMLGNNSCGPHSVMGGRTVDNVIELDVATYDGERLRLTSVETAEALQRIIDDGGRRGQIYAQLRNLRDRYAEQIRRRFPDIPRRVSGFAIDELLPERGFHPARALVGSEGTCCFILEATVRLIDNPVHRGLVALGYADVAAAADDVPRVMKFGPIALEGVDDQLINDMAMIDLYPESLAMLPQGRGWLLVEFGGDSPGEVREKCQQLRDASREHCVLEDSETFLAADDQHRIWSVRKAGLGATAHVPHKEITWEGWEDSAVPPPRLGDYLRELRDLYHRYGYQGDFYGHFGGGCVHTRINFDLETPAGIAKYTRFLDEASDLVLRFGGSLSGEHGDGQSKAQFLEKMYGPELIDAFREFKSIWDPDWRMNPGKVVQPYRIDQNLRLGADYNPSVPDTWFHYPADNGDFGRAMLRCVGVGECRKHNSGTMCPSYMATREEQHSTRGRAHLLYEMLQGDVVKGGWRDEGVKESLDYCLSCKGCRQECPVHVDMATYKAEFLAHYYEHRLRPLSAYAFGFISRWLRMAGHAPALINRLTRQPQLARWGKRAIGMAQARSIPQLADRPFTRCTAGRRLPPRQSSRGRVILWPDTFTNFFHPQSAMAALEVLEAVGYEVTVPRYRFCCGRPLYEFGLLEQARRRLLAIMDAFDAELRAGTPIVVLEPSCASVFRDECQNLLPYHEHSRRLADQVVLLSELLVRDDALAQLTPLDARVLLHGHCHHRAVMTMQSEQTVLERLGVDYELLDSGCCGMAGSYGFETDKYDISMAVGERVLLPRVRAASADTIILSNGFSCREQIRQGSGRTADHLADLLRQAIPAR